MQRPYSEPRSTDVQPSIPKLPLPNFSRPAASLNYNLATDTSFPPSPALTPRGQSPAISDSSFMESSFILEQKPLFAKGHHRSGFADSRNGSETALPGLPYSQEKLLAVPDEPSRSSQRTKRRKWIIVAGCLLGAAVVLAVICAALEIIRRQHPKAAESKSTGTATGINTDASDNDPSSTATAVVTNGALLSATPSTAVVTQVPNIQGNWPQGWTQEMVFPTGYVGTGRNGLQASARAPAASSGGKYTQLVAFGSSYSDNGNGRARDPKYASSLSPAGYFEGRWSNGYVWVEYLRDMLGNKTDAPLTLYDGAYGGATCNNSIHASSVPDTGEQIQTYLSQVDPARKQKALITTFTSTNDVTMELAWMVNPQNPHPRNVTDAVSRITAAAQSLVRQLLWLIPPASQTGAIAPDFYIVPIDQLALTSRAQYLASKGKMDISVVTLLSQTFNSVLMAGLPTLTAALGNRGNVFTYDFPSLLISMTSNPTPYGITNTTGACFWVHCQNPDEFIFWDNLHLTTQLQHKMATIASEIVMPSQ